MIRWMSADSRCSNSKRYKKKTQNTNEQNAERRENTDRAPNSYYNNHNDNNNNNNGRLTLYADRESTTAKLQQPKRDQQ